MRNATQVSHIHPWIIFIYQFGNRNSETRSESTSTFITAGAVTSPILRQGDRREQSKGICMTNELWKREMDEMEIDKAGDYWIIRFFPNREVVLQLKIRQYTQEFLAEFTCEIRLHESDAFIPLAQFKFEPIELADECEVAPSVDCFP